KLVKADNLIPSASDQLAVRGDSEAGAVGRERTQFFPGARVPNDDDGLVRRWRRWWLGRSRRSPFYCHQERIVRRKGDLVEGVGDGFLGLRSCIFVQTQLAHFLPGRRIPDPDGAVPGSRGDRLAIWSVRDGSQTIDVAPQRAYRPGRVCPR